MTTRLSTSPLVRDAHTLAQSLLAEDSRRLQHVRGAGLIAGMTANAMRLEQPDTIVAAALLHDIGYAPALARTGFHPLDGALFLAREGWPDQVVLMVAHHSHAAILAPYYGVSHHLALLDHVLGLADDVITFSDLRAGENGLGADPRERVEDMRHRHSDRIVVPDVIREARYRMLLAAAARVDTEVRRATHLRADRETKETP